MEEIDVGNMRMVFLEAEARPILDYLGREHESSEYFVGERKGRVNSKISIFKPFEKSFFNAVVKSGMETMVYRKERGILRRLFPKKIAGIGHLRAIGRGINSIETYDQEDFPQEAIDEILEGKNFSCYINHIDIAWENFIRNCDLTEEERNPFGNPVRTEKEVFKEYSNLLSALYGDFASI